MKSVAILALAAGASATFRNANPFTCPSNTDNKCDDKKAKGFDWSDAAVGKLTKYGDFDFNGWDVLEDNTRRDRYDRRTLGKNIHGSCGPSKDQSPSFGCKDAFSLDQFHLSVEFDADLEFHYDMPDGSKCKQRSSCKKGGSKVKNRQCGGAKNVTILFPPQKNKPKPKCGVVITSIDFDCSTKPPKPTTKPTPPTTKPTKPPADTTTTTSQGDNPPTSPPVQTPPTKPVDTPPTSSPVQTPPTKPVDTPPSTTVITTSFISTSTVFTTSTSTIISCADNKPSCPGNSTPVVVTVTIPVSTTLCPVSETRTTTLPGTLPPPPPPPVDSTRPATKPPGGGNTKPPAGDSTKPVDTPPTTTTTTKNPPAPVETLPCPPVVPSCIQTWLFTLEQCRDNTDSACYCPDRDFVKNVFECLYAYGRDDDEVEEAVRFFQGICAPQIPSNPAIVTGPTCTSYLTPTRSLPAATIPVVTVVVSQTAVVPCTDSAGAVIPSSSTTVTINTSVTVPQLDFTTTGPGDNVGLVPITTPREAVTQPPPTTAATRPANSGAASGTGTARPPPGTGVPQVNAAGRVSFGAAAAVLALVAAF